MSLPTFSEIKQLYDGLIKSCPTSDLSKAQKLEFVTLSPTLDRDASLRLVGLIGIFRVMRPDKASQTQEEKKERYSFDELNASSDSQASHFELAQFPHMLRQLIYRFAKLSETKMREEAERRGGG